MGKFFHTSSTFFTPFWQNPADAAAGFFLFFHGAFRWIGPVEAEVYQQFLNTPRPGSFLCSETNNFLMTAIELQDFLHVYSMISFRDGRKEPGLLLNKYDAVLQQVRFYFIPQAEMQAYKTAFDRYDREVCNRILQPVEPTQILGVRPVSLSDYKMILQLLHDRNQELSQMR